MQDRARRIIETAVRLAEQGGFEAVRLRDVASNAGVALGTLYRHFRSKEDLLMAALSRDVEALGRRLAANPITGGTPHGRVTQFFSLATENLCGKPNFARAVLRAAGTGDPELVGRFKKFRGPLVEMCASALRGRGPCERKLLGKTDLLVGELLQSIWFAGLIGWMGGQDDQDQVVRQVSQAADLMLRGLNGVD